MVGMTEVLIGLGAALVVIGLAGRKLVKDKKARTGALVGGIVLALVGLQVGGYFAFLTAGAGPSPAQQGLWDAIWVAGDSDTDRTETESLSVDLRTMTYVMSDANMDGLGDVNMGADIRNLNTGTTEDLWAGAVSIVKIGTVIVSGVDTPVANYTADRTRFNIAFVDDDAPGDWTQEFDRFKTTNAATGGAGSLSIDLPIDPAVADDLPAGGSFDLIYNVAGVQLTVVLQES